MDRLIEVLFSYSYQERKLLTAIYAPSDNLDGYYVFTLTPPNYSNFDEVLCQLFQDHLNPKGVSCNIGSTLIEFSAHPKEEDELVNAFKTILEQYTLNQINHHLPPVDDLIEMPVNALQQQSDLNENELSQNDEINLHLKSCLKKLMESWQQRTAVTGSLLAKTGQFARNKVNSWLNNNCAAIDMKKQLSFVENTGTFSQQQLTELLQILTSRLQHVRHPSIIAVHRDEITTLNSAIQHAVKLRNSLPYRPTPPR